MSASWVAHASRVSGERVLAIANFSLRSTLVCKRTPKKRLFRRDAETNTRGACATRKAYDLAGHLLQILSEHQLGATAFVQIIDFIEGGANEI
jgi:hypothetical protein